MEIAPFRILAEALAIGLLIGVERYKDRTPGEQKSAGMRTFSLFALLGAICGLLDDRWITLATFMGITLLLLLGYYRHARQSFGLTTEIAGLLTFWLGYLVHDYESLAISTGIVVAILLAFKRGMHGFVKERISEAEFYDTLKFLAVVFVAFPLLPDQDLGPYGAVNPRQLWILVVLVSTISYAGYFLIRTLGGRWGLGISAVLGGLVSTPAATMALARRAREAPQLARACGMSGVMANAVQFPRLLVLVWAVEPDLGRYLALPLLGMLVVGMVGAFVLGRRGSPEPSMEMLLQNPYSLRFALEIGLLFALVFLISKVAIVWLGTQGLYAVSAVAGLGDASAMSLSAARLVSDGSLTLEAASAVVLIAVTANALFKWGVTLWNGNRQLASWLGAGLAAMLVTGGVLMVVQWFR